MAGNHTCRRYSSAGVPRCPCLQQAAESRGAGDRELSGRCLDKHDSGAVAATTAGSPASCSSGSACSRPRSCSRSAEPSPTCCRSPSRPRPCARCTQIVDGASSQVFAANGTRLGFIQSDELRSPIGWSEIPANLRNATVAIEDQRFYKDDGVDPTGIFRAAVKDVTHGEALQGALDDHDAADAQPLPRRRPAHAAPEDHRGEARARIRGTPQQARDPHQLSQQRPLRHARRADRDRRAGGLADLLRQAGLAARPRAGGAARGAAAGALGVQPVPVSRSRARTPQRGARQDGRTALRQRGTGRGRRRARRWSSNAATSTPKNAKASSSNTSASS